MSLAATTNYLYCKTQSFPYLPDDDPLLLKLDGASHYLTPIPVVIDGTLVDIEIHGMFGMNEAQKAFFIESMKLKALIYSSLEFKVAFHRLTATERNGKSLDEVYEGLILGKDRYSKKEDRDIDVLIHLYKGDKRTLGYHNSCCLDTYTNYYHFEDWRKGKYGRAIMAGHSAHEYFHVMGYPHRFIKSKSLVYQSGYLVRDLGKMVIDGRQLTPISA